MRDGAARVRRVVLASCDAFDNSPAGGAQRGAHRARVASRGLRLPRPRGQDSGSSADIRPSRAGGGCLPQPLAALARRRGGSHACLMTGSSTGRWRRLLAGSAIRTRSGAAGSSEAAFAAWTARTSGARACLWARASCRSARANQTPLRVRRDERLGSPAVDTEPRSAAGFRHLTPAIADADRLLPTNHRRATLGCAGPVSELPDDLGGSVRLVQGDQCVAVFHLDQLSSPRGSAQVRPYCVPWPTARSRRICVEPRVVRAEHCGLMASGSTSCGARFGRADEIRADTWFPD
jgi:hypothetical protein